jgi:hypothetical protein
MNLGARLYNLAIILLTDDRWIRKKYIPIILRKNKAHLVFSHRNRKRSRRNIRLLEMAEFLIIMISYM